MIFTHFSDKPIEYGCYIEVMIGDSLGFVLWLAVCVAGILLIAVSGLEDLYAVCVLMCFLFGMMTVLMVLIRTFDKLYWFSGISREEVMYRTYAQRMTYAQKFVKLYGEAFTAMLMLSALSMLFHFHYVIPVVGGVVLLMATVFRSSAIRM